MFWLVPSKKLLRFRRLRDFSTGSLGLLRIALDLSGWGKQSLLRIRQDGSFDSEKQVYGIVVGI